MPPALANTDLRSDDGGAGAVRGGGAGAGPIFDVTQS